MSDPKLTFWAQFRVTRSTATGRNELASPRFAAAANDDFVFEADIAPDETLAVAMGAVEFAEFLFIQTTGGDASVSIQPEGAADPVSLQVSDGLLLSGTKVAVVSVSSVSGCHVYICGAAK